MHTEAERRKFTAYHEAGHAVVAWTLGHSIKRMTVIPGKDEHFAYAGYTQHGPVGAVLPQHVADTEFCVLMAGAIVDRITCPDGARDDASGRDLEIADALLATGQVTLSPRTLWNQTEDLIHEQWERIDRLAMVLLQVGELDAENVASVLEAR